MIVRVAWGRERPTGPVRISRRTADKVCSSAGLLQREATFRLRGDRLTRFGSA